MSSTPRERPDCRRYILRLGLRPHIEPDGKWRKRAVNEQGEVSHLSDGLRKQMRLMAEEGLWLLTEKENTEHVTATA
jgi:hypothetical protein